MIQLSMMMQTLSSWFTDRMSREEGQDFVEYAVILSVVVVAAVVGYKLLGTQISGFVSNVANSLTGGTF